MENMSSQTMDQNQANVDLLKLVEELKSDKEFAICKNFQLEKQLYAREKLEEEMKQLKGRLQQSEHMVVEVNNKMEAMDNELKEKNERIEHLEAKLKEIAGQLKDIKSLEAQNDALNVQKSKSNAELREARKELIYGLWEILTDCTSIGIKRMGELDYKAFQIACKERFSKDEAEIKAAEFFSKWEDELSNPDWHPFFGDTVEGESQLIIDEDDEKLQELKKELGDGVYNAVTISLLETNYSTAVGQYNPSGIFEVRELWNFKEKRKATLKEVIQYVLKPWKTQKRKRT